MMKKYRNRPPAYRFTETDRERIKDDLRPDLKSFIDKMEADEGQVVNVRALPYLGPDWRLLDEGDDRHNVVFPLRTDIDLRKVRTAVDALFPDDAADLKNNIVGYIQRQKQEKRKWNRGRDRFFDTVNLMRFIWPHFGSGWIAGQALFNILTPDAESRARWEKNLGRRKVESFRVPVSTAAKVVSELLYELHELKVSAKSLEMMFKGEARS